MFYVEEENTKAEKEINFHGHSERELPIQRGG